MNIKLTYCLILLLSVLMGKTLHGQQLPLFSQYLFNGFIINPAYAGLNGYSTINLTAREQWVGLENAPTTHIVSFQTRLLRRSFVGKSAALRLRLTRKYTSGRVGIGGYIYNDKVGLVNRTGAQATYAYHTKLSKGTGLSLAISGSVYQFYIDRSKITTTYENDPLLNSASLNMWIPDFSVGAVYSSPTFFGGISANQLLQAYLKLGAKISNTYRLYRQYNITGGYRFEIDNDIALEPSILIKTTNQLVAQADISIRLYYNDCWGGLSYRTGSAAIAMFGVKIDKMLFGYAYDYNFNSLQKQTYGTHELMVAFKFGDNPGRMRFLNR